VSSVTTHASSRRPSEIGCVGLKAPPAADERIWRFAATQRARVTARIRRSRAGTAGRPLPLSRVQSHNSLEGEAIGLLPETAAGDRGRLCRRTSLPAPSRSTTRAGAPPTGTIIPAQRRVGAGAARQCLPPRQTPPVEVHALLPHTTHRRRSPSAFQRCAALPGLPCVPRANSWANRTYSLVRRRRQGSVKSGWISISETPGLESLTTSAANSLLPLIRSTRIHGVPRHLSMPSAPNGAGRVPEARARTPPRSRGARKLTRHRPQDLAGVGMTAIGFTGTRYGLTREQFTALDTRIWRRTKPSDAVNHRG